ncbi:hypothetical protein RSA3_05220 [Microbacterium testaceum]|uniref:Rifampin ADP-ribosyltransferase domain-containing protein n=1 Tax=Microbacterium testaceum TaxID=2033 RepID=A0A147F9X3_MICTE|nr:hypothetical protein RSA3_05220 [Microbacterium testaceum]
MVSEILDAGPFFHGTKAALRVGDLLTPGFRSNYRPETDRPVHTGSVVRISPQFTHDHATRKRSSSRISNDSGSPHVGHRRGSGVR